MLNSLMRTAMPLFVSSALLAQTAAAEDPFRQYWFRQLGTESITEGHRGLVVDAVGHSYTLGYTQGDLGAPFAGGVDAYVIKHSPSGEREWITQIGGDSTDYFLDAAFISPSELLVAGWTDSGLSGPSFGSSDAFLARLTTAGDVLWVRQYGSPQADRFFGVDADPANATAVAVGLTYGAFPGPQAGSSDALVVAFDTDGEPVWSLQFGSSTLDVARAVAIGPDRSLYVGGEPAGAVAGTSAGYWDAWLARLDPQGNTLWIRQFGLAGRDRIAKLVVLPDGRVVTCGSSEQTPSDPNGYDAWVALYSSDGDLLWRQEIATPFSDGLNDIAVDAEGRYIVGGATYGELGSTPAGGSDAFLARLSADGSVEWVVQLGSAAEDWVAGVAIDSDGLVYVSGDIGSEDPLPGNRPTKPFVARYGPTCPPDLTTTAQSTQPGYGEPNGVLNHDDFFYFLLEFGAGNLAVADLTTTAVPGAPGYGTPNGILNNDDFFYYLTLFAAGC
ncbi:MAG: GC-type dockerin domain-anchored protein [Phycisphaerales bacterium]